jgi:hypothetical protein
VLAEAARDADAESHPLDAKSHPLAEAADASSDGWGSEVARVAEHWELTRLVT